MKKLDLQAFTAWFGILMIAVVVFLAVMVMTTDIFMNNLTGGKRTGFVVLMLAYAVYRGFRVAMYFRSKRNDPAE